MHPEKEQNLQRNRPGSAKPSEKTKDQNPHRGTIRRKHDPQEEPLLGNTPLAGTVFDQVEANIDDEGLKWLVT